jgi:long-chain acyl-CoA synthetase
MITLAAKTLAELCLESSERYGDRPAFRIFSEDKISRQYSYRMLGHRARQFGLLLTQLGIAPGDRVLLFSENSPEWPIAYFGIAFAGAVSVPLLTGFSSYQVENIATQAGVKAIILNSDMLEKIGELSSRLPLVFLDKLEEITASIKPGAEDSLPKRYGEDLATIIYTSGTSGSSKGVMLSNINLISNALATVPIAKMSPQDRFLSVLPLAHSYECTLGMLSPIIAGSSICYLDRPPSPSILLPAAKEVRPTLMAAVPVLIEKMYRSGVAPKLLKNPLYRFPLTRRLAILFAGRKMKAALGGKIRFFGIGGAPLSDEVERFLRRARFPFAIGYGLTEAAPLIAGEMFHRSPFRSTGAALEGVEVRINGSAGNGTVANGSIGEIQVRGPNVMMGYYHNEEQTREAFTADGWLKTGDLGSLDKNGKLYIRGRSKALILGPSGENIYPEEIEGLLNTSSIVEEALVYSNEQGELVAMVRLTDAAKAAVNAIEQALEELRSWANKKLASFSRLSRIELRCEPFEKTPTMKIKRYLYV